MDTGFCLDNRMVEVNLVLFLVYFFSQCFGSYFMVEKDGLQ